MLCCVLRGFGGKERRGGGGREGEGQAGAPSACLDSIRDAGRRLPGRKKKKQKKVDRDLTMTKRKDTRRRRSINVRRWWGLLIFAARYDCRHSQIGMITHSPPSFVLCYIRIDTSTPTALLLSVAHHHDGPERAAVPAREARPLTDLLVLVRGAQRRHLQLRRRLPVHVNRGRGVETISSRRQAGRQAPPKRTELATWHRAASLA